MREAWTRYRDAHLVRKGRSAVTIDGYRDHVERVFKDWLDKPLKAVRSGDFNFARRVLHIPNLKGGAKRAFDIPLSREMIKCIVRAMRYGHVLHPLQSAEWLFPSTSASGHLAAHKEDRSELSKLGNDLRQTYRTIATIAEVSDVNAKLLMNHAISGVNQGYITRHKLLEDHLRARQQAVSTVMFADIRDEMSSGSQVGAWLGAGAAKRATRS